MPLAICRIQKIKSWGSLVGNSAHTARDRDTPNANPLVTTNVRLIGSPSDPDLATLVKAKIGERKIRSNAVLAVELLLSASPEYFRPLNESAGSTYNKQRLDDFVSATVTWLHSTWGDRLVRAQLHLDEITPHIHAYLVPLDERGKLNCRQLLGTREKLSQLQDSYAQALAHLGIERGVKASIATHTKIKEYYSAVNQKPLTLELDRLAPKQGETAQQLLTRILSDPTIQTINHQLADRSRIIELEKRASQKAIASEKLRQHLEQQLQSLRHQTKLLLDLPLEQVAYELGLNQDKHDKYKWTSNNHTLNIGTDALNALSLVMHVNRCEFDNAVVWLRDRFGEEGMLQAVTHHTRTQALNMAQSLTKRIFVPPQLNHDCWAEVEHHLTHVRALPKKLVQALYKRNLVYADDNTNAVFLTRSLDHNEVKGAYLYPITNTNNDIMDLHPGSQRKQGWFHLTMGDGSTTKAVLANTPIEILSLATLNTPHKHRTLYLTIDSEYAKIPIEFLQNVPNVVIAMPTTCNKAVPNALPQAILLKPNTTWNQQLKNQNSYQTVEEMER